MGRLVTDTFTLVRMYGLAEQAVVKAGKCPKCWNFELALACFGRETQTYTVPDGDRGIWAFDVDKARELVGDRVDGEIAPGVIRDCLGESEPGHELCLLRRANAGLMPKGVGPVGLIVPHGESGVMIDGTHRGRLAAAAGVPLPIAVLTAEETKAVMLMYPPNTAAQASALEVNRLCHLFTQMKADEFFTRMVDAIGKDAVAMMLESGPKLTGGPAE